MNSKTPMNLSASLLASFWGGSVLSCFDFLGTQQQSIRAQDIAAGPIDQDAFLNKVPPAFEHLSVSFIKDNLAVIPGEWDAGDISKYLLSIFHRSLLM